MKKPELSDYAKVPNSTICGAVYDYKAFSLDLLEYIKYIESKVKKLNIPDVSAPYEPICPICGIPPIITRTIGDRKICHIHGEYVR